jgi:FtsZ-binding cell division protein ZapB
MNRERFTDIFLKILHKAVENLTLAVQMCIEDSKGKILEYKNASYISTQFERLKDIALQISTLQTNWYARLENTHIVNDGIQDIVVDTQDRL